jgi:hypothetical protein
MSIVIIMIIVIIGTVGIAYLARYLPAELQQPVIIGVVLIAIVILVILMLRVSGVALP